MLIAVPYHLDQRLERFDLGVPVDLEVTADLSEWTGSWPRMAVLYQRVADAVASPAGPPVVVSGDCTTSLGVLAGLQRAGHEVGVVWLDAHADFHTETTTTSGYLGGLPLALAVGVGTLTLPDALGLRPVPPERVLLVDARDTDPAEHVLLERSSVVRVDLEGLVDEVLPSGKLYLHVDVDVADLRDVPGLLYPVPGGPRLAEVTAAVRRVVATGRVAAVGLAMTWRHDDATDLGAQHDVLRLLLHATT